MLFKDTIYSLIMALSLVTVTGCTTINDMYDAEQNMLRQKKQYQEQMISEHIKSRNPSPLFRRGFIEGKNSSNAVVMKKDKRLYKSNEAYRTGWDEGYMLGAALRGQQPITWNAKSAD